VKRAGGTYCIRLRLTLPTQLLRLPTGLTDLTESTQLKAHAGKTVYLLPNLFTQALLPVLTLLVREVVRVFAKD
jgi:hypothetical protein